LLNGLLSVFSVLFSQSFYGYWIFIAGFFSQGTYYGSDLCYWASFMILDRNWRIWWWIIGKNGDFVVWNFLFWKILIELIGIKRNWDAFRQLQGFRDNWKVFETVERFSRQLRSNLDNLVNTKSPSTPKNLNIHPIQKLSCCQNLQSTLNFLISSSHHPTTIKSHHIVIHSINNTNNVLIIKIWYLSNVFNIYPLTEIT